MARDENLDVTYEDVKGMKKDELVDLAEEVNAIYGTELNGDMNKADLQQAIINAAALDFEPMEAQSPATEEKAPVKKFKNKTLLGFQ
jgi:hypothetical protein